MQEIQKAYKNFSSIPLKQVKRVRKIKNPIYKNKKIVYKKYKINSKRFNISIKEKQNYIAMLQIGIVRELKQQGIIITDDEMLTIIKQLKKKNKLEVEI